jgi:hypothetical protein
MNFFLRFSIAIFLLKIAVQQTHRIVIWVALITIQVYSVYFFFLFIFQCWPVQYFWERFGSGSGTCLPSKITVSKAVYLVAHDTCADFSRQLSDKLPLCILSIVMLNGLDVQHCPNLYRA